MYTAVDIANYFLTSKDSDCKDITSMKLNKLVYIAYCWYLTYREAKLFKESPEAWKYGPVIPSVYHTFKGFGSRPVTKRLEVSDFDSDTREFLDLIWETYGDMDGIALSDLTHQPNTPWSIVWSELDKGKRFFNDIPDDLIVEHYNNLS